MLLLCIVGGLAIVGFIYLTVRGQRQDEVADEPVQRIEYGWESYYDPTSDDWWRD